MAARIAFVRGPQAPARFAVRGDVRIGVGPGHDIRVQDPAWAGGHLLVQHRPGGYAVTNRMAHPVFLDGKPLPSGVQQTWFAGAFLQPTAATVLRLDAADESAGPVGDAAALPEPPVAAAKANGRTNALLVGLLLAAAAFAFGPSWFQRGPDPAGQRGMALARRLANLREPRADALGQILRGGLLNESKRDVATARLRYREAHDRATAALKVAPADSAFAVACADAKAFAAERLAAMAQR